MKTGLVVVSAIAVFVILASPASAQDRFSKFQQRFEKRWEDLRPKGKLLQQIRDSFTAKDDKAPTQRPQGQPTPADPQSNPNRNLHRPNGSQREHLVPRQPVESQGQAANNPGRTLPSRLSPTSGRPDSGLVRPSVSAGDPPKVSLGIVIDEQSSTREGLYIARVATDSPAARAGLRPGDRIISVAGLDMTSVQLFDELLGSLNPQDQVMVEFVRNHKTEKAVVGFVDAAAFAAMQSDPSREDSVTAPAPPLLTDQGSNPIGPDSHHSGLMSVLDNESASYSTQTQRGVYPSPGIMPAITGSSATAATALPKSSSIPVQNVQQLQREIIRQRALIRELQEKIDDPSSDPPDDGSGLELLSPDGD